MTYVSADLRPTILKRAGNCCEYCLRGQEDSRFSFHIEHIIAEKHGGETLLENLGLSCPECNAFKGSDVGSYDRQTGLLTPLFNPRKQTWVDHFHLHGTVIEPLTPEGRVTVSLLQLNRVEHLAERELLLNLGRYPCKQSE
jgi:hypothetical protein